MEFMLTAMHALHGDHTQQELEQGAKFKWFMFLTRQMGSAVSWVRFCYYSFLLPLLLRVSIQVGKNNILFYLLHQCKCLWSLSDSHLTQGWIALICTLHFDSNSIYWWTEFEITMATKIVTSSELHVQHLTCTCTSTVSPSHYVHDVQGPYTTSCMSGI